MKMYLGQAQQDKFVLQVLSEKRNGYFIEIGSNHPQIINNTFLLETQYDWKGIMVEYDARFLPLYKQYRPQSIHVIQNATQVNYKELFINNQVPTCIDYLQIDLEAVNGSTIQVLEKLDNEVLDSYKFATITFEHDIYHTNNYNTRDESRSIFNKRGYIRVFTDVENDNCPYEDWYVHPDLVNMNKVQKIIEINQNNYVNHPITGKAISWKKIQYP